MRVSCPVIKGRNVATKTKSPVASILATLVVIALGAFAYQSMTGNADKDSDDEVIEMIVTSQKNLKVVISAWVDNKPVTENEVYSGERWYRKVPVRKGSLVKLTARQPADAELSCSIKGFQTGQVSVNSRDKAGAIECLYLSGTGKALSN